MSRRFAARAFGAVMAAVTAGGPALAQTPAAAPPAAHSGAQPGMMGHMPMQQMQQHMEQMQRHMQQMQQHMQQMHRHMAPGGQAPAAQAPPAGGVHDHTAAPQVAAGQSPATAAFVAANERMHRDMAIAFTGDADRDFAAAMIPHHEGAIAMARIVLQHGRDPQIRQLAEAVIREQEREIVALRAFLARPR